MGTRYSSRYLGIVSLERFLAVERYCESHQPAVTAQPRRAARPGDNPAAKRPGADRASAKVR
jgi:hypothetical protein